MMELLRILSPASPPQVPCSHGVGVVNKFVKLYMIPRGDSGINSRLNIFGASDKLGVL